MITAYKGVTYHQDSRRFAAFFEYFIDSLDTLLEDWLVRINITLYINNIYIYNIYLYSMRRLFHINIYIYLIYI